MVKLYRSRTDRKLFGLCGGLAEMLDVDSNILRVVVLITVFFSGGTVILLYFLACLVIPKEPAFHFHSMRPPGYPHGYWEPGANSYHRPPYDVPPSHYRPERPPEPGPSHHSTIDSMMAEIEKKALHKEIEELRAKLAKYEKGGAE